MKGETIRSGGLIWLAVVAVAASAGVQSVGCATPEQRHRVLTFFFDGVPPLHPEKSEPTAAELAEREGKKMARLLPPRDVSVHDPVADKECDDCHESQRSNELVEQGAELCWTCHDRDDFVGKFVHGPVAAGYCNGCHDPHRSQFTYLLVAKESRLCEHCHDENNFPGMDAHRAEKGADCQRCHDPHAAARKYMLKSDAETS